MKINVFGSSDDFNSIDIMTRKIKHMNAYDKGDVIYFPENMYHHPKSVMRYIQNEIEDAIYEERNITIVTYSDHVLNGVRIAVKRSKSLDVNANVYQFNKFGETDATIDKSGRLSEWAEDVFDTWDKVLLEIL